VPAKRPAIKWGSAPFTPDLVKISPKTSENHGFWKLARILTRHGFLRAGYVVVFIKINIFSPVE
jgi:hypothetical protein